MIISDIYQVIERKGIITAYVNFFDDSEPERILAQSCFQGKTVQAIHDKVIERETSLTTRRETKKSVRDELRELYTVSKQLKETK